MKDHKTYAYFYVSNFNCTPEVITSILGLTPTNTWCKGDRWGPDNIRERKENFWHYKTSESTDDYNSNVHFNELLKKLEKHKDNLSKLPSESKVGITYVPTCNYCNIAIILDNVLLKRIVNLGLSLDYDIYSLPDDE